MARVTVVVPTLAADHALDECLASLERQTYRDFEVVVVDNSGRGAVGYERTIRNERNVGFGAAINQAAAKSEAPLIATLNDDAVADEGWLAALVRGMEDPEVGMCASQVRLAGTDMLDSAGMMIAKDGTSKQRGHGRSPAEYRESVDVLLPSGSAALYRRELFEELGGFAGSFFLYCEDTDLGLRARRAGWRCRYMADAVVEHRYSHSAGRVSPLKAYLVERNRLWTVLRNFPSAAALASVGASAVRYAWHLRFALEGRGAAAEYSKGSGALSLGWLVVKAHAATLAALPRLLRERREVRRRSRVTDAEFAALLRTHAISLKEVAAL